MWRAGNLQRRLQHLKQSRGSNQFQPRGSCANGDPWSRRFLSGLVLANLSVIQAQESAAAQSPVRTSAITTVDDEPTHPAEKTPNQEASKAPQLKALLDAWKESCDAIAAYDLNLSVKLTWPMKTIVVDASDPERPNISKTMKWVPLDPGEAPQTQTTLYRQVRSRNGRRRIEIANEPGKKTPGREYPELVVDDGTVARILRGTKDGSIRESTDYRLEHTHEYLAYIRLLWMDPFTMVIQQRPNTHIVGVDDAGLVEIVFPNKEARPGESMHKTEFRVWLDPSHGHLPKKVRYSRHAPNADMEAEWVTNTFHEVKKGVWAPVDMSHRAFNTDLGEQQGKVVNDFHIAVDVQRSRWDPILSDDLLSCRSRQA